MRKTDRSRIAIGLLGLAGCVLLMIGLWPEEGGGSTGRFLVLFCGFLAAAFSGRGPNRRSALRTVSAHLSGHFRKGRLRYRCGQAACLIQRGGKKELQKALALLSKAEKRAAGRDLGAILFMKAFVLDDLEQREDARERLEESVQLDDDNPDAWNMLGYLLVKTVGADAFDRAEWAYRRALELQPDYPLAAGNLGALYYRRGSYDRAKEWLEKALQRQERPETLAALALTEAARGQQEAAWRCCGRAEKAGYQKVSFLRSRIQEHLQGQTGEKTVYMADGDPLTTNKEIF